MRKRSLSDEELADAFRNLHQELIGLRDDLFSRGYTSQTYTRENGESVRQELRMIRHKVAKTDTIKFHKTQVTTITV